MNKQAVSQQAEDYRRIGQAIEFVQANFRSQPTLAEIAASAQLSKYHFHRLFKRWAGISPVKFMQFLTLDYAKQKLAESQSLLAASFDAGLSGPSRLHDLFVTFDAVTPGEFKRMGAGLQIEYGIHPTPFGQCLLASTERGICHLSFVDDDSSAAIERLQRIWPNATLVDGQAGAESIVSRIFSARPRRDSQPFHLLVRGTNFQVNVWRALLTIPRGRMLSYADIANHIGHPKTVRAVGQALAVNAVAYLIPCHRVIARSGKVHRYRWGSTRKQAILGWEAAGVDTGVMPNSP